MITAQKWAKEFTEEVLTTCKYLLQLLMIFRLHHSFLTKTKFKEYRNHTKITTPLSLSLAAT